MNNKSILLAVTGSIAAYKACEIIRLLRKEGANVQVMMSKSAEEFVGKDQDTDGTEIIDKILKGFHLKLLNDIGYLENEFEARFIRGINKTLKKKHNESGDYSSKLSESYLIPIAQEVWFKDYSQYQRQETSEKNLESKLRERKC